MIALFNNDDPIIFNELVIVVLLKILEPDTFNELFNIVYYN